MAEPAQPFSLLTCLYPDHEMTELLSAQASLQSWVRFEHALARAQAEVGVLTDADADAIAAVTADQLDANALWSEARNVGYPILPLVRQMSALLPAGPDGRVHYGATTQDAMDTGLALQLRDAAALLVRRIRAVGDRLCELVAEHSDTVMPGRTHGQHAVPTTFGAQLASVLAEMTRAHRRMEVAGSDVSVLSLFGAGGTSAALGPRARDVRAHMAEAMQLNATDVSWHTSRDSLVALAHACTLVAGVCARLARNVIDLSRTEIGELHEAGGTHRGASSTMPQKANPILSEGIIGLGSTIGPMTSALARTLEVPQERAAGEWQIEWHVLPQVLQLTSSALSATTELVAGLRVEAGTMRRNLELDGALAMSESAMIALADSLGREAAHDLVYAAALDVRSGRGTLAQAVARRLSDSGYPAGAVTVPEPEQYLGDARLACQSARHQWISTTTSRNGERDEKR
jgi:3-carboxy-cis,cis-muconate cycloisomerase